MKTNRFWYFMAAAAVFAGMTTLVSCDKEEPFEQEIIESEVLEEGVAEEVTEETGTEGTTLSYESWIVVKGQTRAAFENRVSVTLNNTLNNVSKEIEVENWETGEAEISLSYKAGDSRKNGDYVTVTDSVLVCTVSYPNFSFDYELIYQVAVYDDGVTRQIMPYYTYENLVDNGCTFTELEDVTEDGVTYKRQQCTHSITVTFNDREYTVSSAIVLKKAVKGEDVLLASKVVDEGIEFMIVDEWSGKTISWIEIEQTWSESGIKKVRKEVELANELSGPVILDRSIVSEKFAPTKVVHSLREYDLEEIGSRSEENVVIKKYQKNYDIILENTTNSDAFYTYSVYLIQEQAVYQDEKLTYNMPTYQYEDVKSNVDFDSDWSVSEREESISCNITLITKFAEESFSYGHTISFIYSIQK